MGDFAKEIQPVNIEDELKQSYLDYAMSVIVGRALPDVRDGLKPVHRRVLYAMRELGNEWNKPYKKSARVVGDVIGKYHPHGDAAVYDTIVRMAQSFSMRYLLVDGQGNFGSVDGDAPAAMRYTEIRMTRMAHDLLLDIERETVDFSPNYDGTELMPDVLPARVPNLLVNGSSGIAVGMATNIPPHNLREVSAACLALLEDPAVEIEALLEHLPGPDFPTGGIINGKAGILQAYHTGRGRIYVRGKAEIQQEGGERETIIITELPFQVNKARLVERIADLVKDKKLEGISGLRDESDKDGIRIVVQLQKGHPGEVALNNLYAHTALQSVFGINMVALEGGRPRFLNLKEILEAFLTHRRDVVTRRSLFLLRRARERAHILEGLAAASACIDEVVALIRASASAEEARQALAERDWKLEDTALGLLLQSDAASCRPEELGPEYGFQGEGESAVYRLSPVQTKAILELRLHRLTGLEQDKIKSEYETKINEIKDHLDILSNPERMQNVIREELEQVAQDYGDERRTEIRFAEDLDNEALIPDEERFVTLTRNGYIVAQRPETFRSQHRGGMGSKAVQVKEGDFICQVIIAKSHDTLLCFSSQGRVYWLKVYQIPTSGRYVVGRPLVNLLQLEPEEQITTVVPVRTYDESRYVLMATAAGKVSRVLLSAFSRPRKPGIRAIKLHAGDRLTGVKITDGDADIMLLGTGGRCIRFHESDVRATGRNAGGVRGMRLRPGQQVAALIVPEADAVIFCASDTGYGKRVRADDFSVQKRGGQGVRAIKLEGDESRMVGAVQVAAGDELMLIDNAGTLIRTAADGTALYQRAARGVRVIRLKQGRNLVNMARVVDNAEDEAAAAELQEEAATDPEAQDPGARPGEAGEDAAAQEDTANAELQEEAATDPEAQDPGARPGEAGEDAAAQEDTAK